MGRSLRFKFLLLLVAVAAIALSGAVILRNLMLMDFRAFLEGESEDRIYLIQAGIEGTYERNAGWQRNAHIQEVIQALGLGFEIKISDQNGSLVIDTASAVEGSPPLMKRRLKALGVLRENTNRGALSPYPLFLGGKQIGTMEVRELQPLKGGIFLRRSNLFLLMSVLVVGGLAISLSLFFSRRLTRPIEELAHATSAIRKGDLAKRVTVSRRDEVGDLSKSFNAMARDLETHESLRRKLIADVAHELRTPLGAIRGELEAMMDGLIPNDQGHLQSLYDETGRLKKLVDGIEDLNQAESSVLYLKKENFEIKPFLENIAEQFRRQFQDKRVDLALECHAGQKLYADPERLSQIMVNLLSNTLRATGEGGEVLISVQPTGEELAITVRDNGAGIREEDLPFIFERFYHGPDGGLGIGLTIVKDLAEAHGARVEVKSSFGAGSSFTIIFPLKAVHNSS